MKILEYLNKMLAVHTIYACDSDARKRISTQSLDAK